MDNQETDASAVFAHQPGAGTARRLVGRQARNMGQAACPGFRQVTARIGQASLKPGKIAISRIDGAMGEGGASKAAERTIEAYLAAEFGHSGRISVSASLEGACQQQSSCEDRAACAELLALLSAIAGLPLPQTIAVAGTIDQFGRLRSEVGINCAVEEFFDACRANAVTGEAGVIIPAACQSQLMLRQDIVDAAAAGKFTVWAVATLADCFAVLTGLPAGTRGENGSFAEGDAYRLVDEALHKLHQRAAHSSSNEASP